MTQQEVLLEIGKRMTPVLQEYGVEGCVFTGYMRLGDGHVEKFVAVNLPKGDVSQRDGLSPVIAFVTMWGGGQGVPPADQG